MTPETIVEALTARGWTAEIVTRDTVEELVEVKPADLMKCVDGRASDNAGMRGPKTLGGIYAIASLRGKREASDLAAIVQEVKEAGYGPSVHGDDHADPRPMGCGYFKLWVKGELDGLEPPNFTAEQGREAVLAAGGVYEELVGDHAEKDVLINLVPNTTREPNGDDQRFVVDAWMLSEFDLDVGQYLVLAAQTVELLNGPKIAKIVV